MTSLPDNTDKEKEYMEEVLSANSRLRMDYLEMRNKVQSIKTSISAKVAKRSS